jgi:histone H3/H4
MALNKSTTALPLASMERILKKAGAERVSDEAKSALCRIIEEIGTSIGRKAVQFSMHAGRKTIKDKDIMLAQKSFIEH